MRLCYYQSYTEIQREKPFGRDSRSCWLSSPVVSERDRQMQRLANRWNTAVRHPHATPPSLCPSLFFPLPSMSTSLASLYASFLVPLLSKPCTTSTQVRPSSLSSTPCIHLPYLLKTPYVLIDCYLVLQGQCREKVKQRQVYSSNKTSER